MAPYLVWVAARSDRTAGFHAARASGHIFTPLVKEGLRHAGVSTLADDACVDDWTSASQNMFGMIVGLLLLQLSFSPDVLTLLTQQQRDVRQFWLATRWASEPLCFMQVLGAACILPEAGPLANLVVFFLEVHPHVGRALERLRGLGIRIADFDPLGSVGSAAQHSVGQKRLHGHRRTACLVVGAQAMDPLRSPDPTEPIPVRIPGFWFVARCLRGS